ncbi:hypothetical protein ATANTOWER_031849 [Ataeniobius toweri]|uniref:UBZ2-type domain-containing protein n=1 Tax=Ataeniobius toweri TaxID=208326 RepID=A0ABU7ADF5_9TELE|nr:hypothetical protein [Ataeniobius toweri]
MAEKCSKSKLKRKKSSVEDLQSDLCSLGAPKRGSSVTLLSGDGATNTDRSSLHAAAAWWNTLQPPAVESLWAFTLMSALPHLQNQHRDPVPDLPLPPVVRPAAPKLGDHWKYDLLSEVPPFPEIYPLTPETPPGLDPLSVSSSQENVPLQTRPSLKTPDKGPPSHNRQSPEQQTAPCQPLLSRSQRPTVHRLEKAASSSAGQPWVKGELKQWSGPVSRQLQTELVKVSNPPVSTGEDDQVQRVGKPEEAALQSCPMCLQGFPAGFTQMERDSHLAQCLSEMNVDMTW